MKRKYEYVVDLGLRLDSLSESVLEEIVLKASRFLEYRLKEALPLRRVADFNAMIYVENSFEAIRVKILLEVVSPKPVVEGYKHLLDRVIDETFNYIESLLVGARLGYDGVK